MPAEISIQAKEKYIPEHVSGQHNSWKIQMIGTKKYSCACLEDAILKVKLDGKVAEIVTIFICIFNYKYCVNISES